MASRPIEFWLHVLDCSRHFARWESNMTALRGTVVLRFNGFSF